MKKYFGVIESQRVLVDCEGVPYLTLFIHVKGLVFSYATYSAEYLEEPEPGRYLSEFSAGDVVTLVGECITISPTHHVFVGRLILD